MAMTGKEFMEKMRQGKPPEKDKRVFFIKDKDGVCLTAEEEQEYINDLFDGGVPMGANYAKDYLWPKWGERLGIPKPD